MAGTFYLSDAAQYTQEPPEEHQKAAWDWLQDQLSAEVLEEFKGRYRARSEGANGVTVALDLIRLYEGLHLTAYPDPLSGGEPFTIGWGTTRYYDGEPVKKGQTISRELADDLLKGRVEADASRMAKVLPGWSGLTGGQQGAVLSFCYNLGSEWYGGEGFSTLSECFKTGRLDGVPTALMLYRNLGTNVELGLARRRRAEGLVWGGMPSRVAKLQAELEITKLPINLAQFTGGDVPKPAAKAAVVKPSMRKITYFRQTDSQIAGRADDMCFSSSAAMWATYFLPGLFLLPNGDDEYLKRLEKSGGESGKAADQVAFLRALGIRCEFTMKGDWALLEREIGAGRPVLVGWLHNGPVTSPKRDHGHWSMVGGIDAKAVTMYDPNGEADLVNGGYTANRNGEGLTYSRKNWGKRWQADGPGSGWCIHYVA